MTWISWSRTWKTKSTATTSRKPLRRSRRNSLWNRMYLLLQADQRLKQNHEDVPLLAHLPELYLSVKEFGLILSQELNRISLTQCQKDWLLFSVMVIYLEKKMERSNSGDFSKISGTNLRTLSIGLMKCGRAKWQEAEATSKDFNIVLIRQEKKFFISELFKSFRTQYHWSFTTGQCVNSGQFLRVHLSYWMCRIDTGRTNVKQGNTDSIIYGCESHEQETQRSVQAWLDQTTSCMVQAKNVEKTPRHGVLGRYTACWTERIEVLSNKIERNHPLRYTPSLLYPESYYDGIWRNHIRESICVTSASSKDFFLR